MNDPNLPSNGKKNPVKKTTIPVADLDLGTVAKKVSAKWTASPWLTLLWTTAPEFATKAESYATQLQSRNTTGSKRPQYSAALKLLDEKIDSNISYVKDLIIKKFKKEAATSYYAEFGFTYRNRYYQLPRDQDSRVAALKQMIAAIATYGFGADEFGTAFWTPILTEYDRILKLSGTTDGEISEKVGDKNVLKADIKKTLNAVIFVLRGNYPDTFAEQLRVWGFQKEKY